VVLSPCGAGLASAPGRPDNRGGCVFYAWKGPPWSRPVWHLFVLAGSALHDFATLFHVIPLAG
jgi:hypothetical protein